MVRMYVFYRIESSNVLSNEEVLKDCEGVNSDYNDIDGLVIRATRDIAPGEELLLTTDMTQVWVPMR
jgi:hypothetical protein